MKKETIPVVLMVLLIVIGMACVKSAGAPGVWSPAGSTGQRMEIRQNGQVAGTVFLMQRFVR